MAKAKASLFPLNNPRWWVLDRVHQYRRRQIGDDVLATQDIRLAVERGDLPVKIEAYDRRTQTRIAQLLSGWFFKCQFQIIYTYRHAGGGDLGAYPRLPMQYSSLGWDLRRVGWGYQNLSSPTFFVWGPKVEELWPDHVATPAVATEAISMPVKHQKQVSTVPAAAPPRGVTERFVYEWMRDHPPYKGEGDYAQEKVFSHRPDKRVTLKRIRNLVGQYRSEFEIERNPFPRETSPRSSKR
jgi:hypothetical protein